MHRRKRRRGGGKEESMKLYGIAREKKEKKDSLMKIVGRRNDGKCRQCNLE